MMEEKIQFHREDAKIAKREGRSFLSLFNLRVLGAFAVRILWEFS